MKKYIFGGVGIVIVAAIVFFAREYLAIGKTNSQPPKVANLQQGQTTSNENSESAPVVAPVPYTIEPFVENLFVPWSIVFTSEDRMLFTERNGNVRVVVNGTLQENPLYTASGLSTGGEQGMMGMAIHPEYETNKYVYLAYASTSGGNIVVHIDRFTDTGTQLQPDRTIIKNIPAARNHAGTRLNFGPDNKLYISTGDASEGAFAQETTSLAGKILRVNDDGSIPADNPIRGSAIYSIGHRNPQGIDWHPETGDLWSTEHGPSVFDGPAGGDEVNLIVKGGNYGWPVVSHEKTDPRFISPKIVYTPAVAPASGMFYSGKMFPQFKHNFFFGGLKGEGLFRVILNAADPTEVSTWEKLPHVDYGRIREVAEGPDGSIYFSTSNQDGRGNPATTDDVIYRISQQ